MILIDKGANDRRISSKVGDIIAVQLEENPTTGYRWQILSYDAMHLELVEDAYDIIGDAMGAGGRRLFSFKVIKTGLSNLIISLENLWEHHSVEIFKLEVES